MHFSRSIWDVYESNIPSASAVSFFACLEEGIRKRLVLECQALCLLQDIIFVNRSSVAKCASFEEEETDRILAKTDDIIVESQPRPMPEILGAGISPTYDAAGGAKGMAPREGSGVSRSQWRGPFPCRSLLLVFHISHRDPGHHNFAQ